MGPGRVGGRKFPRAKKQTERNEQPIGPIGTCDLFGGLFCGQRKQRFGKPIKDHSLGEMSGILLCKTSLVRVQNYASCSIQQHHPLCPSFFIPGKPTENETKTAQTKPAQQTVCRIAQTLMVDCNTVEPLTAK